MGSTRRPRKKAYKKKESANDDGPQACEIFGAGSTETLYCICQRPYTDGDLMVCCDACGEWFHPRCVAVSAEEVQSLPMFVCPGCLEEAAAATATEAHRSLAERFRNERQRYLQQERQRRHEQRVVDEPPAIKVRVVPANEKERTLQEGSPLIKNETRDSASKRTTDISNEQASSTVLKKRKSTQEKVMPREKTKEHAINREQATSAPQTVTNSDAANTEIVRSKARRMLFDALQSDAADGIESALFELMDRQVHDDYRARLRNLVANLRDPRNGELREAVLSGALPADALCQMNSEELACKELRMKRQEQLSRAEKLRVIERAEEVGLVFKEVAPPLAREPNVPGASA
ncbi:hypothetical protein F1559_001444 [Cyanidiococcus yangmingshanensis]|uniref:PHD-type domain-containing protein n=1 Tax=Cyanidiococcus yangmingshanensis TaxID=2690220 RepID=A0A7J7IGP1_9RHOD|nr:hypothetical protein F1559_001444 [Cyanidiococcus yangmingshanensis]